MPSATIQAVAPHHVRVIATKLIIAAVILADFGMADATRFATGTAMRAVITNTVAATAATVTITITQLTISGRVPS